MTELFTVGHSSHPLDRFIALLQSHRIEVVADVRSRPYSVRFPHFCKDALQQSLKLVGVRYVFLGRELGARREEPQCYVDGQAAYDRIARLPAFAEGIARVLAGTRDYRVALMCAEHDPLTCHRTILVCREIKRHGVSIQHITRSGALEDREHAEQRLIAEELGKSDQRDMFDGDGAAEEMLETAYSQRARKMAYTSAARRDRGDSPEF